MKKNVDSKEMSHIVRIQRKRKAEDNKDTRVVVRGRVVAQDNIDRWEKRQQKASAGRETISSPQLGKTPFDIHIRKLRLIS